MYFPYFRGKQFELMAIREAINFVTPKSFFPIIEPVKLNLSPLKITCDSLLQANIDFCIIANPQCGEILSAHSHLDQLFDLYKDQKKLKIGFIINSKTNIHDINRFISGFPDNDKIFIHYDLPNASSLLDVIQQHSSSIFAHLFVIKNISKLYVRKIRAFSTKPLMIQIEDSFQKKKNADYPKEEHFSEQHILYEENNMNGFGDFLIVGDEFSDSGGPAYAVAIHLTYINYNGDEEMRVYHFVSDSVTTVSDPGGKFLEALNKLIAQISQDKTMNFTTQACSEFKVLHQESRYPGLGYLKKLSMLHHIELIDKYISDPIR